MKKTVNRESKSEARHAPVSSFCSKILAIVLLLTLCLCLGGCQTPNGTEGTVTFVVAKGEDTDTYIVPLSIFEQAPDAFDVLDFLEEECGLDYEALEGAYGVYLTKVGDIVEDGAAGVYVGLWTSYEGDFDVSVLATEVDYNGKTLTSSGVGLSSMHIEDGVIIYIGELVYG